MTKVRRPSFLKRTLLIGAIGAAFALENTTQAQTWNVNAAGSWNNAANWNPASVPNAAAAVANLEFNISAARAITLDAAITVGSLTIGDTNETHAFTLSNGTGGSLTFDNSGSPAILNQAATSIGDTISASMLTAGDLNITNLHPVGTSRTLTLSGTLSASTAGTKIVTFDSSSVNAPVSSSGVISDGSGVISLVKTGSGVLTLTGLNTYTGGTTLDLGGVINLNAGSTTGSGAVVSGPLGRGAVLVKNGTTLRTNGNTARTINNIVTFQGSVTTGSSGTGALTIDPTQVTGGVTTIDGATTLTVSGANLSINGRITGVNTPSLTKSGTSDLVLTNNTGTASSFGSLTISNRRVFISGSSTANMLNSLGSGTVQIDNGGGLVTASGGTEGATFTNSITINSGGNLGARQAATFSNITIPTTGTAVFNFDDATTETLTGTIVGAPSLTGPLSIQSGGGTAATVGNVALGGAINNNGNLLTLDTRTATTTASVLTLSGVISGAGGITKTSNASTANTTAILSGANTFDGVTTVDIGTLRINNDLSLGSILNGTVVNTGGTLSQNSAGTRTIAGEALTINGTGPTGGLGGALHVGSNSTLNYNGPITVASASTIAVNGGSTLNTDAAGTIDLGSNTLTIQTDGSTSSTLSGAISGATGNVVKNGVATLVLNATNTYGGTTTVNGGVLTANTTAALPGYNTPGLVTVNTGATLRVPTGTWTSTDIDTLRTNANFNTGSILGLDTAAGDFSYGNLTDVSNVVGTVGLTKSGANTLTLTGANTYTGTTTISGGTLTTATNFASPALVFNGGTFLYQPGSGFDLTQTSVPGPRTITMTGAGTIDTNGNDVVFANPIGAGAGALTKTGAGSLTLNSASTYTGTTFITGGSIISGVDNALPAAALNIGNNGTVTGNLDLATFNQTLTGLTVNANNAADNTITIGATKTLTINGNVSVGNTVATGNTGITNLDFVGGGALVVNGGTGTFVVGNTIATTNNSSRAIVDMSALSAFTANYTLGSGTLTIQTNGDNQGTVASSLILSNTANSISVNEMRLGSSSTGSTQSIKLGAGTNVINVNTLRFGNGNRDTGRMDFAGAAGTVTIRNQAGTGRVTLVTMGNTSNQTTGYTTANLLDTTGHTADIAIATLTTAPNTRTGNMTNDLKFDTGTLDIRTVNLAVSKGSGNSVSTITIGGGNAFLGGSATFGDTGTGSVSLATSGATGILQLSGGVTTTSVDILRNAGTGVGILRLNGGTLNMSGKNLGDANTLTLDLQNGTIQNIGEVNNGAGLVKNGAGILTLSGTNTYTGGTIINNGVLELSSLAALPAIPTPNITTNTGGTWGVNFPGVQAAIVGNMTTASTGAVGLYAGINDNENVDFVAGNFPTAYLGAVGNVTYQAPAVFTPFGTTYRLGGSGGNLTFKPAITGVADVMIGGDVTFDDTNPNTYSGGTIIHQGVLTIASDGSLGAVPGSPATNLTFTGSTVAASGGLRASTNVSLSANRSVVLSAGAFTLDSNGNNLDINGDISGTPASVTKTGLGNVTLSGNNSFTGTTTITGGTLITGSSNALAGTALNYNNLGGTLGFGTQTAVTLGSLAGAQDLALTNTTPAGVILTVGGSNASTAFTGVLSGIGGGLTKNGTGTLTLGGATANTYTGLTTVNDGALTLNTPAGIDVIAGDLLVNGGTVNMNADNQLPDTTNITVNGGFFRFANGTAGTARNETIASITINGPGDVATTNGTITTPSTVVVTGTITVNADSMVTGSGLAVNSGSNVIANKVIYNGGQENVIGGNNPVQVNTLTVGPGGLEFTGGQLKMNLGTAGRLGSNLILNGDVTSFAAATDAGVYGSTTNDTNGTRTIDLGTGARTFTVADGAAVNDLRFEYELTNTADLIKAGPGLLRLDAANTYTGTTSVNAGTLVVNNTTGSGTGANTVTVAAGARIGGTGTITGVTDVSGGFAPGSGGIGTLNITNNVTWNAGLGSSSQFELGAGGIDLLNPGTSDLVNITGNLIKGTGTTFTLDFANTGAAGWYKLLDWSGSSLFAATDFTGINVASGFGIAGFTVDNATSALYVELIVTGAGEWIGLGGSNWTTAGSWSGSVPNSNTSIANFNGMGGSPVLLDANQQVNQLNFNSGSNYTLQPVATEVLSLTGTTPTISTAATNTATQTVAVNLDLAAGTLVSVQGGTLELNSPANAILGAGVTATVANGATLSLGGAGNALSNGTSTHANVANSGTLLATTAGKRVGEISGTGTTTVNAAGATLTANHIRQSTLNIGAGNTVTVASNGGDSGTSVVTNLSINATGKLDLTNNDLVVDNGNLATLTAQLASGLDVNGSYGNGPGITSSAFANDPNFNTVLGIAANVELGYTTFSGQTVDANDVLIKYTYYGDADLSGSVDTATDFDLYITGLTSGGSLGGWLFGDFDYSGTVDSATDFDLYITGLTSQGSPLLTAGGGGNLVQAVPEPSTFVLGGLALLGFAGVGIRRRRLAK